MKFKFKSLGKSITAQWGQGGWEILEGDKREVLTIQSAERVAGYQYFPTTWDRVNATCATLGGVMLDPKPLVSFSPGVTY